MTMKSRMLESIVLIGLVSLMTVLFGGCDGNIKSKIIQKVSEQKAFEWNKSYQD